MGQKLTGKKRVCIVQYERANEVNKMFLLYLSLLRQESITRQGVRETPVKLNSHVFLLFET